MRKLGKVTPFVGLFIWALAVTGIQSGCKRPPRAKLPDFQEVSAQLRPSVVSVITTGHEGGQERWGMGSGVVVGQEKFILTNAHVLQGAKDIYVQLGEGAPLRALPLAVEPRTDLALLELQAVPARERTTLAPITWSSSPPAAGQWAICMGHPYGLGHTVTVGVVSGRGRDFDDMGRPTGLNANGWWSMLQVDAAMNVGNSGGPIVDEHGRVMGIATAIRNDGQGLAFAIPAAMARHFVQEVRRFGNMRVARLGATVEETGPDDLPGRLRSLRVRSIAADGPAQRAGLKAGDILLRAGPRELHRLSGLSYEVQKHGVGARIAFKVLSKDAQGPKIHELDVVLGNS